MKSLDTLVLNSMSMRDISFLDELPDLRDLYLIGNQIEDISPIMKMQKLTWVNLSGNPLENKKDKLQSLREKGIEVIYE